VVRSAADGDRQDKIHELDAVVALVWPEREAARPHLRDFPRGWDYEDR